jgi:hypothetical protein
MYNKNRLENAVYNINVKHVFSKGRELTADIDYGTCQSGALSRVSTNIYELNVALSWLNDIRSYVSSAGILVMQCVCPEW